VNSEYNIIEIIKFESHAHAHTHAHAHSHTQHSQKHNTHIKFKLRPLHFFFQIECELVASN
jgi:hypothetical protein